MTIFFCISENNYEWEKKMPAYFSIDISIKGDDIYDGIYSDLLDILRKENLNFQSGVWEFIDEPFDKIITWNEQKISQRFELSYDEKKANDYRQIFLDYNGFSEVRLIIMYDGRHDEFIFSIIMLEDELLQWDNGALTYNPHILQDLRKIITNIWNWKCVSAIQTTLELSGNISSIEDLEKGNKPSVFPFAVIPTTYIKYNFSDKEKVNYICRDGVFIECL